MVVKANSKNGSDNTKIKPTPSSANNGLLAPIKPKAVARLAKITPIQANTWA